MRQLELPDVWIAEGEDAALARAVEAGCYAQWLLASGDRRAGLHDVVTAATQARERLWALGLKIAMQQACRHASADCAAEDLFQESCIAVAEAINRYDFTRGVRFSTFVHECVSRAILAGIRRHRIGQTPASRADRRAAARAHHVREQAATQGIDIGMRTAAAIAGVSDDAVARGCSVAVCLDDVVLADPTAQQAFEEIPQVGYLDLLPQRYRTVLRLRYGLDGPPLSLTEIARLHGTSVSTAARWEREALASARQLLDQDLTRRPPVHRTRCTRAKSPKTASLSHLP